MRTLGKYGGNGRMQQLHGKIHCMLYMVILHTVKEGGAKVDVEAEKLDVRVNKNPRKNASTLDVCLLPAKVH